MSEPSWSRARMYREIADLSEGGLPAPHSVTLWEFGSGRTEVEIRLDDGAAADVDAWAAWAGMAATAGNPLRAKGQKPFRSYAFEASVSWPGWGRLTVASYITVETRRKGVEADA